ncbi:hypothetical protein SAMN02927921_02192 [Sinomicrobium oceani]|uniref:Lipocalin-like domain-containing protein n=2 Tax=Sinomicrobium oceani TaxID=1150368 RepID=A0A1K1Q2W2_9FLAO|nr:hypothetical protein SAMN02927921_02192 [Sinomicrobium oceani]
MMFKQSKTTMKTVLAVFLLVSVLGCGEDTDSTQDGSVTGRWKMTRQYISPGDDTIRWTSVKDGDIYEFRADSTFVSNGTDCQEGRYAVQGDSLRLDFQCDFDTEPHLMRFYFEGSDLVLSPLSPTMCIEACLYRYEKID